MFFPIILGVVISFLYLKDLYNKSEKKDEKNPEINLSNYEIVLTLKERKKPKKN